MSLRHFLQEFLVFGIKQAWACIFGGIMLALMIGSKLVWQPDWSLARYDFLLFAAIITQCVLLWTKLETFEEAKVILLYHVVGTVMEIFKTHVGSWAYPEANILRIGGVPLFSGFMYSCIGSYITRAHKVFDLRYQHYPSSAMSYTLCILIYLNFFSHHYIFDMRYVLFAFTVFLFLKTQVYFTVMEIPRRMPLLLSFLLISFFIWIAENIGTFTATWKYPHQQAWELVSMAKLGSWFLLMIISFVLVTMIHKPKQI